MIIGAVVLGAVILLTTQIIDLYMKPSADVLDISPSILRQYFMCLHFVSFNVFPALFGADSIWFVMLSAECVLRW